MLTKKLLTLACAVTILGFGACFLPPTRSPAPPLPPYLASAHTLAIDVEDVSGTEPFEKTALSKQTAQRFMNLWDERSFRAVPQEPGLAAEATLHITILEKQATLISQAGKGQTWNLQVGTRMEMAGKDGHELWQMQDRPITFTRWRVASDKPFSWKESGVMHDVAYNLALRAGTAIHYPSTRQSKQEQP